MHPRCPSAGSSSYKEPHQGPLHACCTFLAEKINIMGVHKGPVHTWPKGLSFGVVEKY